MYFRKYFAGTIEDRGEVKTITDIANGGSITAFSQISNIICLAIKETLQEAGITCEFNTENYVMTIDGLSVQIVSYKYSTAVRYSISFNGLNLSSSLGISVDSGANYRFYVTLKGDIDGLLKISIGSYSSPAQETYGFVIGKGIDLRDGTEVRAVSLISNMSGTNNNAYILKNDSIFADYKSTITFGWQIGNVTAINNSGAEVTMIEAIAQTGRFKLNNCYFGNAAFTVESFYNIGGEIYYYASSNILVKCVNKESS